MKRIVIHTDGGARGNPGPSGIGVTIADADGVLLVELSEYIGVGTNNVAEYTAVKYALTHLQTLFPKPQDIELNFFLDSQLVERQLTGVYKIKEPTLQMLAMQVKTLYTPFGKTTFTYIPREKNKDADRLANEAMDKNS
jgi:probable phosphoglycerate mutase